MSRMIFALCALTITSGCCEICTPRGVSIVQARLETLGPSISFRGKCGGCDDCIPCRPFKDTYEPWWDYHITEHTAHRCAFRALREYRHQCGKPVSHHFKCGFISAYEDLALNRRPSPPVVPPPKYWNAYYRSCAGQGFVDDWYAGYDAGLEMGSNSGVSRFHEIYLRRCGGARDAKNQYGDMNQVDYDEQEQYAPDQQAQFAPTPQSSVTMPVPVPTPNAYPPQGRY